ncbi:MAG: hypothetical protein BMS9Abin33_1168 [Gammaproteobacteria bacterium]|nr:MAG: hypothetical protein BMS9Abin33_1168 [Gammaproteobacteria bacterium]
MTFIYYRSLLILMPVLLASYSSNTYSSQSEPTKTEQVLHVSPSVTGVKLESEGSLYWLHFDADADSLWPKLKEFWANEGIRLKREQPQLGFMETEWIKDLEQNKYRSIIFSDRAPEIKERFRLRVERLPENAGTRVFIHNSSYGILLDEEAVYAGYLPPSPELEIEMLSRLALFSGADKNQVSKTASTHTVIQLQAIPAGKNTFEILMPGSIEFVSKKLVRALDRMDVQMKTEADGTITATSTDISKLSDVEAEKKQKYWEIDDSSDLEERDFSGSRNKTLFKKDQPSSTIYRLKLIADKFNVTIRISNRSGNSKDGLGLSKFSQAVARNLSR